MAASSSTATIVGCCLGPPAAPKQAAAAGACRPQAPACVSVSSHAQLRACVAAAACAVMVGMAGGGGADIGMALALARDGAVVASKTDAVPVDVAVVAARAKAPPRWSDGRQCPPWRANSLENIVPENLPRPSAPRRFDSVSVSATEGVADAPALVSPPSFLALRPGTAGCFSL